MSGGDYWTGFGDVALTRAQVQQLQNALMARGYNVGATGADGIFGPNTQRALQSFQAAQGFPVRYGATVDERTAAALGLSFYNWQGVGSGGSTSTGGGAISGGGSPAGGGAAIYFEWKAPARLQLLSASAWGTVQAAFGQLMQGTGFQLQYNSYELQFPSWALVVRGLSPAGLTNPDALNNRLISLAEQSGFTISRDAVRLTLGSTVPAAGAGAAGGGSAFLQGLGISTPLAILGGAIFVALMVRK